MAAPRSGETPGQVPNTAGPTNIKEIPFNDRVCRGLVAGQIPFEMNARTPLSITATAGEFTDITQHPKFVFGTSDKILVTSDDDEDGVAGTGATTVIIWGLSSTRDQVSSIYKPPWQSELITMDGTNQVESVESYVGSIVGAEKLNVGSVGTNVGNIDVRKKFGDPGELLLHRIEAGRGIGRLDQLSVPFAWGAFIHTIWVSWTGSTSAVWELRSDLGDGRQKTLWDGEVIASNSGSAISIPGGIFIEEASTVWFRAHRNIGPPSDTMQINAQGSLFVTDDTGVPPTAPAFP